MAVRATDITDNMKIAAAKALSEFVPKDKLSKEYILPTAFEQGVADCISGAVAICAREDGIARA